jgi:hypothetical protein
VQHTLDIFALLKIFVGGSRTHAQDISSVITATEDAEINKGLMREAQLLEHLLEIDVDDWIFTSIKATELDGCSVNEAIHVIRGSGGGETLFDYLSTLGFGLTRSLEDCAAHKGE